MSDKVLQLAAKAKENGDASSLRVSVEQLLENILKDIRSGKITPLRCVVALENDGEGPDYYSANTTFIQALGCLEFAKLAINENMRRGE